MLNYRFRYFGYVNFFLTCVIFTFIISGSLNLPFPAVLEGTGPSGTTRIKSPEALHEVFSAAGANLDRTSPMVGSCGSGLTACVLALAVYKSTGKLVSVDPRDDERNPYI